MALRAPYRLFLGFSSRATASTCGDHRNWSIGVTLFKRIAAVNEDAQVARQRDRIAGDRGDQRHVGARDLLRLVLGAGARRVEDEAVEGIQLLEGERPPEQIAAFAGHPPQAGGETKRAVERGKRRRIALRPRALPISLARRSAKLPQPAKRSATFLARARCRPTMSAIACSAGSVACRKAPGGTATATPPNRTTGFFGSTMISPSTESLASPSAMTKLEATRRWFSPSLPDFVNRDIEARTGHRDRHAERFGRCADQFGERFQAIERGDDLGQRDRAFLDGNDFGGQRSNEAEAHACFALSGGEHDPSACVRRAGHQGANVAGDALDPQRVRNLVALPLTIGFRFQVLEGAAATFGEMSAGGIDPQRRGFQHRHQRGAILLARGGDEFTGRVNGMKTSPVSVSATPSPWDTQPCDGEARAHRRRVLSIPASRNSRLPSPPSIGDRCRPQRAPTRDAVEPVLQQAGYPRGIVGILQQSALADRRAAGLELRLDQKHRPGAAPGDGERRRQRQFQRDEADVGDDEIRDATAKIGDRQIAGVDALR